MSSSRLRGPCAAFLGICAATIILPGCSYDLPSFKSEPEAAAGVEPASAPGAGDRLHTGSVPATVTPGNLTVVQVRHGDSLASIARAHGMDWHDLAAANQIKAPYTVSAGQTLILPAVNGS